jgi:hypothetical protein
VVVTPHWPSYQGTARRGLGLDVGSLTTVASSAGAAANAGDVFNPDDPTQDLPGQATAQFNSLVNSAQPAVALQQQLQSAIGSATGQAQAAFQGYAGEIQAIESYPGAAEAAEGMITAAGGGVPTDAQLQGAFTVAATAGAVALGATATAAATIVAPLCAVVWGAGYAIGALVQNILGITSGSPAPCSGGDTAVYGTSPGDPNWQTYMGLSGPELGAPWGPYAPQQAANIQTLKSLAGNPTYGAPANWPYWTPYTRGAFENWAGGIIIHAEELWMNCKKVPPDNTATTLLKGLVGAWNAQYPNAPKRQINIAGLGPTPLDGQIKTLSNTSFPTSFRPPLYWQWMAWQGDPIQYLLTQVSNEQGGNIAITVADPPLTPPAASAPTTSAGTAVANVAAGTAVVGGAALTGTAVYAFAKGQAVSTVLKSGLLAIKGWFIR